MAKLKVLKRKAIQQDVKRKVEAKGIGVIAADNGIQMEFYLVSLKGYIDSRRLKDQALKARLTDIYNKYHRDIENSLPVSSKRLENLKQDMIELNGFSEAHKVIYNAYTEIERELMINTILNAPDVPRVIKLNLKAEIERLDDGIKPLSQDMKTRAQFAVIQHFIASLKNQDVSKWYQMVKTDTVYYFRLMAKRYQENGDYSITDRQMLIAGLDELFPKFGGSQNEYKKLKTKIIGLFDSGKLDKLTKQDFKKSFPNPSVRNKKFGLVTSLIKDMQKLKKDLELVDPINELKNKALAEFRYNLEQILSVEDAKQEANVSYRVSALISSVYESFVDLVNNFDDINSAVEKFINDAKARDSAIAKEIYQGLIQNFDDDKSDVKFNEILDAMSRAVGNEVAVLYEESMADSDSESPENSDADDEYEEVVLPPINIEVEFKKDLIREIFKKQLAEVFENDGHTIQLAMMDELPRQLRFRDKVDLDQKLAFKTFKEFPGKSLNDMFDRDIEQTKYQKITELLQGLNEIYQSDMTRDQYLVKENFDYKHLDDYDALHFILIQALEPYKHRGDTKFDDFLDQARSMKPPITGADINNFSKMATEFNADYQLKLNSIVSDYLSHEQQYLETELRYSRVPDSFKQLVQQLLEQSKPHSDQLETNKMLLDAIHKGFRQSLHYMSNKPDSFIDECKLLSTKYGLDLDWSFKGPKVQRIVADYVKDEGLEVCAKDRRVLFSLVLEEVRKTGYNKVKSFFSRKTNLPKLFSEFKAYHHEKDRPISKEILVNLVKELRQSKDKKFKARVQEIIDDYLVAERYQLAKEIPDKLMADWALTIDDSSLNEYHRTKSLLSYLKSKNAIDFKSDNNLTKFCLKYALVERAQLNELFESKLNILPTHIDKELIQKMLIKFKAINDKEELEQFKKYLHETFKGVDNQLAAKFKDLVRYLDNMSASLPNSVTAPTISFQAPKVEDATAEVKQFTEKLNTVGEKFTVQDHVRGQLHTKLRSDTQIIEVEKTEQGYVLHSNNPSVDEDVLNEQLDVAEHFAGKGCIIKINGGTAQQRLEILKVAKAKDMKIDFEGSDLKADDYKGQDLEDFNELKRDAAVPEMRK